LGGPEEYLGRIAGAVTDRTRVMAFCMCSIRTARCCPCDLCRFARQRNIVSVVDGAQALGMLDFDLRELECDFYASNLHKWFGGTHGTGLLYGRRELLKELAPFEVRQPSTPDAPAIARFGTLLPYSWPGHSRQAKRRSTFTRASDAIACKAAFVSLAIYARLRLQQLADIEFHANRPGLWGGILTIALCRKVAGCARRKSRAERIIARAVSCRAWRATHCASLRTPPTRTTKSSDSFRLSSATRAADSEEILWS